MTKIEFEYHQLSIIIHSALVLEFIMSLYNYLFPKRAGAIDPQKWSKTLRPYL